MKEFTFEGKRIEVRSNWNLMFAGGALMTVPGLILSVRETRLVWGKIFYAKKLMPCSELGNST